MSNSQFDPESYLDATIDAPSTKRPPLPIGIAYDAVIGEPKARGWTSRDGTKSGTAIDVPLEVQVPLDQQAEMKLPKVTVSDSIMLDVTPDGQIDNSPGANRRLRMYRIATGLNEPGQAFTFRMLQGRSVKVTINHQPSQDGTDIYERVGMVGKA